MLWVSVLLTTIINLAIPFLLHIAIVTLPIFLWNLWAERGWVCKPNWKELQQKKKHFYLDFWATLTETSYSSSKLYISFKPMVVVARYWNNFMYFSSVSFWILSPKAILIHLKLDMLYNTSMKLTMSIGYK